MVTPPQMPVADRRVQRTRWGLIDAFLTLLQSRSWDELSVSEICEYANVGRSTFYAHFNSKEDLVAARFEALKQQLLASEGTRAAGPLPFLPGLLQHAEDNREVFQAIVGQRSGEVIHEHLRLVVLYLVRSVLGSQTPAGECLDWAVHFVAGGVLETLTWWLRAGAHEPAEDVNRRLQVFAARALTK